MKVVITGGAGFIGSNLAMRLLDLGASVLVVDSLIPETGANLFNLQSVQDHPRLSVRTVDVRDVLAMQRLKISADYLQTSAIVGADGIVNAAVNDPNLYTGPGTGYRLEGDRWQLLQSLPHVLDAAGLEAEHPDERTVFLKLRELHGSAPGHASI